MWNLFLIRLRRTPKSTRNVTLSHVTTLFQPPSRSATIARCSRPPGGQTAPTRPPPRPLPASNMVEPQDLWAREHGLRALATTDPEVSGALARQEEHTSELQSLMRNSYAVFCLQKTTLHTP